MIIVKNFYFKARSKNATISRDPIVRASKLYRLDSFLLSLDKSMRPSAMLKDFYDKNWKLLIIKNVSILWPIARSSHLIKFLWIPLSKICKNFSIFCGVWNSPDLRQVVYISSRFPELRVFSFLTP